MFIRHALTWGTWAIALALSALAGAFGARPPAQVRSQLAALRSRSALRPVGEFSREAWSVSHHPADMVGARSTLSVVIPVCRAAATIGRAVDSVLRQSVPVDEIIVVDDGSHDELATALARFGSRVTLIGQPNGGASSARNVGISRSSGELIAFLDADGYWEPNKLAGHLDLLRAHPDLGMVGSALFIEEPGGGRRIDPAIDRALFDRRLDLDGPEAFRAAGMFSTPTVVLRREMLAENRFDESLSTAENREFWLRMLLRAPAWLRSEPTTTCVPPSDSLSRRKVDRDSVNMLALVDRYRELLGDTAHAKFRADVHQRWSARLLANGRSREALVPALVNLRYAPSARALWTVVKSAALSTLGSSCSPPEPCAVKVEVVEDAGGLAALEPEWTALQARGEASSFATTWEWMSTWWEVFGDGRKLRVLTARDGGRLVGVLPLIEREVRTRGVPIRRLQWLGTGEPEADEILSEYLDSMIEPGREREVIAAFMRHLVADPRWDELRLTSIEGGSRTCAAVRDGVASSSVVVHETLRTEAVLVRLAASPAQFTEAQGRKMREDLRRHQRLLASHGVVRLVRATSPDELRAMFPTFIRLHQALWRSRGKPGCFASERFTRFHELMSARLWPRGGVHLHLLFAGDRAVAARYGFQLGNRMFEYQSGAEPELNRRISTSMVATHMCMEEAIGRGATTYDLGEGVRPYKLRWRHDLQPTYDLRVVRRNPRTALIALLGAGEKKVREVLRVVAETPKPRIT